MALWAAPLEIAMRKEHCLLCWKWDNVPWPPKHHGLWYLLISLTSFNLFGVSSFILVCSLYIKPYTLILLSQVSNKEYGSKCKNPQCSHYILSLSCAAMYSCDAERRPIKCNDCIVWLCHIIGTFQVWILIPDSHCWSQ